MRSGNPAAPAAGRDGHHGGPVVATVAAVTVTRGQRAIRRDRVIARWAAGWAVVVLLAAGACSSTGDQTPTAASPTAVTPDAPDPSAGGPGTSAAAPSTTATTATTATVAPEPSFTVRAVDLSADAPDEASGLLTLPGTAASGVPGRYLVVDDDDGPLDLVTVDDSGAVVGRTRVADVRAVNLEALALGPCPAGTCVYVGDIGFTQRRTVTVHRLPLDQVAADGTADRPAESTVTAQSWDFRWPDGPRDAEGLLVEPDGSVLIVEKGRAADRDRPAQLYRGTAGGGDLTPLATFTVPEPSTPMRTLVTGNVVTDVAADDRRVLLLTYDQVVEYVDPAGTARSHLSDFPTWPHRNLPLPASAQAEGVAPLPDGCGYAVVSEAGPSGFGSPVGRLSISGCG